MLPCSARLWARPGPGWPRCAGPGAAGLRIGSFAFASAGFIGLEPADFRQLGLDLGPSRLAFCAIPLPRDQRESDRGAHDNDRDQRRRPPAVAWPT